MKREFVLPVTWEVCGFVKVMGETIEDAMDSFVRDIDHIPLPAGCTYVDGSFALSSDDPEYIMTYQNEFLAGDVVHLSGDSADLWIEGYNVRVDSDAVVVERPAKRDKKVLVTIASIDGDSNVTCLVRRDRCRLTRR